MYLILVEAGSDNYYHSCCFGLCFSDLTFARYIIELEPASFGILYDSLGSENFSAFVKTVYDVLKLCL